MPTYHIVRAGKEPVVIGNFPDLDAVHRLTIFKQRPELKQYVKEVTIPVQHTAKVKGQSNRWRVIFEDHYLDWRGSYSRAEAEHLYSDIKDIAEKLIKVSKTAYHESDGPIDS